MRTLTDLLHLKEAAKRSGYSEEKLLELAASGKMVISVIVHHKSIPNLVLSKDAPKDCIFTLSPTSVKEIISDGETGAILCLSHHNQINKNFIKKFSIRQLDKPSKPLRFTKNELFVFIDDLMRALPVLADDTSKKLWQDEFDFKEQFSKLEENLIKAFEGRGKADKAALDLIAEHAEVILNFMTENGRIEQWQIERYLSSKGLAALKYAKKFCQRRKGPKLEKKDNKSVDKPVSISKEKNYFILHGDNWRVRFNGGYETDIKAAKSIRTLVEYLRNKGKQLGRAAVYLALHGGSSNNLQTEKFKDKKDQSVGRYTCDVNESITPEIRTKIGSETHYLFEQIEKANRRGEEEKADKLENKFNGLKTSLRKNYNATLRGNGTIIWGACKDKTERDKMATNTQKHLKRAVGIIRKKKSLDGLAEHLEKYLLKNKDYYNPPADFPCWYIKL